MQYSLDSSIGQLYQHPAGQDIVDRILLQLGAPKWIVDNPVTRNLRLGALKYVSAGKIDDEFLQTLVNLLNTQPQEVAPATGTAVPAWWKQDVVYQIYPRSFQDSNGDGIGDLRGIINRLDYIKSLGVGAIWMSPIFDSPNDDMGYDIRDYRKIMTEFGSMEDFDELLQAAHERGLKVILDLVVNHTSDEHEWFQEALADPESPYRDYYFFEQGDGTSMPPNNWDSFFSGSAWNHYPEQDVWALHLFSSKQMDLNWDNPEVRREVADIARFWIDKGIDGFRMDVINYISKQPGLPDGSELIGNMMGFTGVEHYFYGPNLHRYLGELNRDAFAEKQIFTVGETPGTGNHVGKQLTNPAMPQLDLVFSFDHLETPGHTRQDDYRYDLEFLKTYYVEALEHYRGQYWMSLFFENHDNPRMVSKVNPAPEHRQALSKLLGGVLLTLRGTPFLYQGQELGLVNQDFKSIEDLRDVEALNAYLDMSNVMGEDPAFQKLLPGLRDHARTPMPWDSSENAGFSTNTPWIVGDGDYLRFNVQAEEADPDSVLHFYRRLIEWRNGNQDFVYADMDFMDQQVTGYWAYRRAGFLVQMNLTERPLHLEGNLRSLSLSLGARLLQSNVRHEEGTVRTRSLEPYEWRLWQVA